jgi:diguanylate cyclase (GGDEF)-like protein
MDDHTALSRWASRSLAWRPPRLQFAPALEKRFQRSRHEARLRHFLISGVVALVVFIAFLLTDRLMVPDAMDLALRLRLGVFTPFALVLLFMGAFLRRFVLSLSVFLLEALVVLSGVFAAACLIAILHGSSSPLSLLYHAGLMPIVVYGNLVQRFKFAWALLSSGTICGLMMVSLWAVEPGRFPHGVAVAMLMVLLVAMVSAYTLFMNYRLELEERRRFLGFDRASFLRQEVERSRADFAAKSRQDVLTSLPNRRCFDEVLSEAWKQHDERARTLCLLLLDVDHFKAFNDRYGHPAGDQCLKLVAQALSDCVKKEGGTLARWGGEEFAVLLPGVRQAEAERIAGLLCQVVSTLGLRHEASSAAGVVTISAGGACGVPEVAGVTSTDALWLADQALYRAKTEGRNQWALQVWPAPTINLSARTAVQTPAHQAPPSASEPEATRPSNAQPSV